MFPNLDFLSRIQITGPAHARCLMVSKLIYNFYIKNLIIKICLFVLVIVVVDFLLLFFYSDTEPPLYNPNTQSYEVGPPGAFASPSYTSNQV